MKKYFKEGDVYFTDFAGAVGVEQKGKGIKKLRPVVILKKYNSDMLLGLPCSTSQKKNIAIIKNLQQELETLRYSLSEKL